MFRAELYIILMLFYWYFYIILILLEIAGNFHVHTYLYCIYITHIYTTSAFLHLHFISSYWAIAFNFAKSFVYVMSCHLQRNFLPYIAKRWWYYRYKLFNPRTTKTVNWPKNNILFATVTPGQWPISCNLLTFIIFINTFRKSKNQDSVSRSFWENYA